MLRSRVSICCLVLAPWMPLTVSAQSTGSFQSAPSTARIAPATIAPVAPASSTRILPMDQVAYVKAINPSGTSYPSPDGPADFGRCVAVSGNTVVIGSRGEDYSGTGVDPQGVNKGARDSGAIFVLVGDGPSWTYEAYIKASNAGPFDRFGESVALSGNTLVVGAPGEDSSATGVDGEQHDELAPDSGAAYVFVRQGATWTQQAYLKASNAGAGDGFGTDVAVSGNRIVVSAPKEASDADGVGGDPLDDSATDAGAVYVFVRSGDTWIEEAYVKASNSDAGDGFGTSVALHHDRLVVGATGEASASVGVGGDPNDNSLKYAGAAYVYSRSAGGWSQDAYLKPSDTASFDQFGSSVSVEDTLVAVGSPSSGLLGSVFVYSLEPGGWTQEERIEPQLGAYNHEFGIAVSLSGNLLLVGGDNDASPATGINGHQGASSKSVGSGAGYLYLRTPAGWVERAFIKTLYTDTFALVFGSPPSDHLGRAAGISGNVVVLGAPGEDGLFGGINTNPANNANEDSGAAYIYLVRDLSPDVSSISLTGGGTQNLMLQGGLDRALAYYRILGSASGRVPGIVLPGPVHLPLNFDAYTRFTLLQPNFGGFTGFAGRLDEAGGAQASVGLPPGGDPSLVGVRLWHAYVGSKELGKVDFASRAVSVLLTL